MRMALEEARRAWQEGEVPIGAVLVSAEGEVLARDHNRTLSLCDPTAHAEVLVLRQGARAVGSPRLEGSVLYVTAEPCVMCAGAMVWARIGALVYGADDPNRSGGVRTLYRVGEDPRLNHRFEVRAGVLAEECKELLRRFFEARR